MMKKLMRLATVCGILIGSALASGCTTDTHNMSQVTIGEQTWNVELAQTDAEWSEGLMYRASMGADMGMLFISEEAKRYSFWMKNTLIPLDIIYITAEMTVGDMTTMQPCPPDEACPSYMSSVPAQYVLEVNGGEFTGTIGDEVRFSWNES